MLLRALRKGDEVITPAKQVAVVTAEADNDGRVLRIAESLLVYVPPRKPT